MICGIYDRPIYQMYQMLKLIFPIVLPGLRPPQVPIQNSSLLHPVQMDKQVSPGLGHHRLARQSVKRQVRGSILASHQKNLFG